LGGLVLLGGVFFLDGIMVLHLVAECSSGVANTETRMVLLLGEGHSRPTGTGTGGQGPFNSALPGLTGLQMHRSGSWIDVILLGTVKVGHRLGTIPPVSGELPLMGTA
jgi:hypothetical protein